MSNISDRIKVSYAMKDIAEATEESIKEMVHKNLNMKIDSYLMKYLKTEDSEWTLDIKIEKNKKGNYNGNFNLQLTGAEVIYKREDFKKVDDLVQHFFERAKEQLGKK